ncbi:MAG: hypothetical protein ABEJ62_01830 [Candidatus Nanohaloarchaea archaeon]
MEADTGTLKVGAAAGVLLAGFFIAGFAASDLLSTPTGKVSASPHDHPGNGTGEMTVSNSTRQKALQKATDYLRAGPFSYPFTYNITTKSVNVDRRLGAVFYNWTISYVVEANPFKSPIYKVPGNRTRTTKTLTLYVSRNGDFLFQSPPIEIRTRQGSPTGGTVYSGP